jgi:hypothetical protein
MILGVNLGYHSKKLYPLINDQYTVRPDEAFRLNKSLISNQFSLKNDSPTLLGDKKLIFKNDHKSFLREN